MTRQQRQQPESQQEEQQQELNRSQKCEGKAQKAQEEWHTMPANEQLRHLAQTSASQTTPIEAPKQHSQGMTRPNREGQEEGKPHRQTQDQEQTRASLA